MVEARVRSKVPSSNKLRVCSRCHQEKPVADFVKARPKPLAQGEYRTCERCRDQLREIQRAKAAELLWLRGEALVPYANRRVNGHRKNGRK